MAPENSFLTPSVEQRTGSEVRHAADCTYVCVCASHDITRPQACSAELTLSEDSVQPVYGMFVTDRGGKKETHEQTHTTSESEAKTSGVKMNI